MKPRHRRKKQPKPPKHNLVGQRFGYLEVIEMVQNEQSVKGEWLCAVKCLNCNKTKYKLVSTQNLLRNLITSCGCRRDQYTKNTGENSKCYTGVGKMHGRFWSKLMLGAKKREIEFKITKEYAYKLFLEQNGICALSGLPIQFGKSSNFPEECTASLDRIDNDVGYITGNIHWVHKDVNRMRNIYTLEYFIKICEAVSKYNN